jgi:hypothetical protein
MRNAAHLLAPALQAVSAMFKRVGAFIFVSMFGIGCGVGDDPDFEPEPIDPNPNGLVCTDAFKVTGTFTAGLPARPTTDNTDPLDPIPFSGCWPYGTWTFTVTRDPGDENIQDIDGDLKVDRCGAVEGTQGATVDASYSMVVTRETVMTDEQYYNKYVLSGQTGAGADTMWNGKVVHRVKVTEGGGGECEGGIELYSVDGTSYWNLHPALTGTTISGFGDFAIYKSNQRL